MVQSFLTEIQQVKFCNRIIISNQGKKEKHILIDSQLLASLVTDTVVVLAVVVVVLAVVVVVAVVVVLDRLVAGCTVVTY